MSELNWTALWLFLSGVCLFFIVALTGINKDQKSGKKDYGVNESMISNAVFCLFVLFLTFGSLTALTWGA